MEQNMGLNELLEFMSSCSGDEIIDLVHKFQSGGLTIEHLGAEDFE